MTHVTVEQAMQIALGHHQAGRLAEAIYRQVLAQVLNHADALHLLGVLACHAGHLAAAIDLIGRAIAIAPDVAEYHHNLGESYWRNGEWEAAIASSRRAVALEPGMAVAYINLGSALSRVGRTDEAISVYQRAIALWPDHAQVHGNLGVALHEAGRLDQASAALRRAIELGPERGEVHINLGNVLSDKDQPEEAIAAYRRGIALRPDDAVAQTNLGVALHVTGRSDEAIAALSRAIELDPGFACAYNNLGGVYKDRGQIDRGLAYFHRAVEIKPDFVEAASSYLFNLHYHPGHDAQALLAEHRQWARQYALPMASEVRPHDNDRAPDRTMRVGFVSPDFRIHPVGRVLLPLFEHRNRRQTEIVCYSDARTQDRLTRYLKGLADRWHDTAGLTDPQLDGQIRADGIDILVDLALHTAGNRMLVFARKPAPVQVTMLGMASTTGLTTIDYRLTDAYLDPPGASDDDYTERLIRLPHGFWCYPPPHDSPAVGGLPALRNGFVTFGCLNQLAKVSRPALQLWVKILRLLPGARLVLHSAPGSHQDAIRAPFRDAGVDPDRVAFAAKLSFRPYFALYNELDLALDPFPYNGGTTTMDALWMGVPVVTLAGRTAVGRGGVSVLSNIGLPELIAQTPEQYVAIAVELAKDLARLSELRAGLRQRMQVSPLTDGKQYAADVEAALRRMWQTWCNS